MKIAIFVASLTTVSGTGVYVFPPSRLHSMSCLLALTKWELLPTESIFGGHFSILLTFRLEVAYHHKHKGGRPNGSTIYLSVPSRVLSRSGAKQHIRAEYYRGSHGPPKSKSAGSLSSARPLESRISSTSHYEVVLIAIHLIRRRGKGVHVSTSPNDSVVVLATRL